MKDKSKSLEDKNNYVVKLGKIRYLFYIIICFAVISKIERLAHSQNSMSSFSSIYENGKLIDSSYMPITDRVKIQDTFSYYDSFISSIKPSIIGTTLSVNGGSISLPSPSIGVTPVTRSLNSSFQISTTRNVMVIYTVSITVVSALTGTNSGTVNLQISPNNSTWTTINLSFNSGAGVLSTNVQASPIFAIIPAGYYVRLNTVSAGVNTATFTYLSGQEILM
jgi:hypothetical protein